MFKQILTMALVCVLCFLTIPITVLADDWEDFSETGGSENGYRDDSSGTDISEPYLSTENVHINDAGYADVDSIYINSNGFGSFSAYSYTEWIYISNDNIHFYNDRSIRFDGEDGHLYFKVTMDEEDYVWRESYVHIGFKDTDADYFITFEKNFEPDVLQDSDYNYMYDVLYRESSSTASGASDYITDNSQPSTDFIPYLNMDVSRIMVSASGTSSVSRIDVDTNNTGGFSTSCSASWVNIDEFDSDGYFCITFDQNPSYTSRSASIIVSHAAYDLSKTIYVEQSGIEPYLDVNKTSVSVHSDGFAGGFEKCVEVTTKDTGGYIVAVDDGCDWIRVSDKLEDGFSDSLSAMILSSGDNFWVSVSDNLSGDIRTGIISIQHESGEISKKVTVTQSGRDLDTLETSTEYIQFNTSDADTELIEVYAGDDLTWTATSTVGWISVMRYEADSKKSSISETGSRKFYICVKKNESSKVKDGYVRLSAEGFEDIEIYVRQPAREKTSGELLKSLIVSASNKTMYVGQTSKIRFQYPEGMYASDIKKVQYVSNKKHVAAVSKGIIKGKKKGKATIVVKVTTIDNTTKIFKIRIVVDKRLTVASA